LKKGARIEFHGFGQLHKKGDWWFDLTILNPFQILVQTAGLVGQFLNAKTSFLSGQPDPLSYRSKFIHFHFLISFQYIAGAGPGISIRSP
jgi:hypothetical protein